MDRPSSITPRDLECMLCDETSEPKALPLSLLYEITNGFSDEQKIGSDGFAVVYKGMLENMTVAVKRMSNTYMYEKEFQREVECLMIAKHKNVVRFLGYCADTQGTMARHERKFIMADVQHRLLCFEYLRKGSLHDYITDASCGLQWRDRFQIIKGICQGLHYLHQRNIVHFDLKPGNILLDDNMVPKISDFGVSRFFDKMESRVLTKISGTYGYLAPESFNHSGVTDKHSYRLDIYSLGVVITEILTGEKGYHAVDDVVESWTNKLEKSQSDVQLKQVRVCAEIGIECIDSNPAKRPDTQHIINRLNEYTQTDVITSEQAEDDLNELHQNSCKASSATTSSCVPIAKSMWSVAPMLVREHTVVERGILLPPPAAMVASAEYFECAEDSDDDDDLDATWNAIMQKTRPQQVGASIMQKRRPQLESAAELYKRVEDFIVRQQQESQRLSGT